jgi:hypothetical protein
MAAWSKERQVQETRFLRAGEVGVLGLLSVSSMREKPFNNPSNPRGRQYTAVSSGEVTQFTERKAVVASMQACFSACLGWGVPATTAISGLASGLHGTVASLVFQARSFSLVATSYAVTLLALCFHQRGERGQIGCFNTRVLPGLTFHAVPFIKPADKRWQTYSACAFLGYRNTGYDCSTWPVDTQYPELTSAESLAPLVFGHLAKQQTVTLCNITLD